MLTKNREKNEKITTYIAEATDTRRRILDYFKGSALPNEEDILKDLSPSLDEIANQKSYTFSGWIGSSMDWTKFPGLWQMYNAVSARLNIDLTTIPAGKTKDDAEHTVYIEAGKIYGLYFELATILDSRNWESFKFSEKIKVKDKDQGSTLYRIK